MAIFADAPGFAHFGPFWIQHYDANGGRKIGKSTPLYHPVHALFRHLVALQDIANVADAAIAQQVDIVIVVNNKKLILVLQSIDQANAGLAQATQFTESFNIAISRIVCEKAIRRSGNDPVFEDFNVLNAVIRQMIAPLPQWRSRILCMQEKG